MKDLLSILRDAPGSIRLEVSGEDLLAFSKSLIDRAKEELAAQVAEARKERYLTKEQVKELCGVCDATLWHWNRKGYLKAVKVGNKVRYRTSDIQISRQTALQSPASSPGTSVSRSSCGSITPFATTRSKAVRSSAAATASSSP